MKTVLALFIAVLAVIGCASGPVRYVGVYQEERPAGKVCDPSGWWCQPVYAPARTVQTVPAQVVVPASTSTIIFFQTYQSYSPPVYYTPPSSSCCWNGKKWWRW